MQSHSMLTLLFIAVLTVLFGYLSRTEAASTERPYQFGFTIEKQQHRQEKKDERGIVMGEFGFITADGIYHVTVYATDEEGKFRILAMRSYPYEENPKTIEMIVRPKAKPTTPKAIAPITPTERAKPKPFEKHNFSVQGCSGCFIKNDAPTTTTKKPEDKKYDISLLSRPLAPEETPLIGKHFVSQVLPQVIQEIRLVETKLIQTATNVPLKINAAIGSDINLTLSKKNTQQQATQKAQTAQTAHQKPQLTTVNAKTTSIAPHTLPLSAKTKQINVGKPVAALSRDANLSSPVSNSRNNLQNPQLITPQKEQGSEATQHNLPLITQTQTKPFETLNTNGNRLSAALVPNKAYTVTQKSQPSTLMAQVSHIPQNTASSATQTQMKLQKPFDALSTNANQLSPVLAPNEASSAPPSSTLNGGKAKTPTIGAFGNANSPQGYAKTGTNAFAKPSSNQPSGGAKGSINGISTPKTQLTTPALNAGNTGGNTGGGKGNTAGAAGRPSTNTGFGGGSGGNKGFGVNNNFGGNSGSGTASGSKAGKAAVFGGSNAGSKAGSAAGSVGGSGGIGSTAGEAGDLYRFKYLLDYNGHRETGSHSGNKEGSFYAIGDDNVERTIEYIANEFGYQPRVRFRKLDAPVKATENTLKDYEFVWFKKA